MDAAVRKVPKAAVWCPSFCLCFSMMNCGYGVTETARMIDVGDFGRSDSDDGHNRREPAGSAHARGAAHGERISVEAIVAVLVRKGLCSETELIEEEARRLQGSRFDDSHYVRIGAVEMDAGHWDRPQHPLRRVFAKYRWSRRLGTALFGWKWKKLRKDHSLERMH
jgi:hypothetical protein